MITLRHFREEDAPVLERFQAGKAGEAEIRSMIRSWESLEFRGRYFEMFAVLRDGEIVGTVSLYHHSPSVVSAGIETFPPFRRQGIGKAALNAALTAAAERGYRVVQDQVRTDNLPSLALHRSLGFETDGYEYRNRNGNPVLLFLKLIGPDGAETGPAGDRTWEK